MSDVHAEYAELAERFRLREEMFERTQARHRMELDMVYGDLCQAGKARDDFAKAHPEVRP